MGMSLCQKILAEHLVTGELLPDREIGISIDQTLTQDATGTMTYLQFEAIGIPRVRTKLSVSYADHNMLQNDHKNADDHRFLQSVAAKYGILFSRPGNGICHQVHLERFSVPGQTLLGADSHTTTSGGIGMLAIGAGGLDVAVAMAGRPFYMSVPKVLRVDLIGQLRPWVTAKDIILEMLRRLSVKGGVGKVIEYGGPGIALLTVPERGTITNMGAELGATTSIFPSDEQTLRYLTAQGRPDAWRPLAADVDATYDEAMEIDLDQLEPLVAQPHSPDGVVKVRDLEGLKVQQVCVGSCTNSSYVDLMRVASILKGKVVHPETSVTVTPGSRQVYQMIAREGALADLIAAGVRVLESACGPCVGMGQAPSTDAISIRTFNRNFEGRSGTPSARVYLSSPEVAAAAALAGQIVDPRKLGEPIVVDFPAQFTVDDRMILSPPADGASIQIQRGPNIKPLPLGRPLPETLVGRILLKAGDNITTDDIAPAGARVLPLRSNVPALAEFVFEPIDPAFVTRAKEWNGGLIVGGNNYGQGSSREHAALAPMYLGVRAVIVKSFARIHRDNLVNVGILPLTFAEPTDYDRIEQGDELSIQGLREGLLTGQSLVLRNLTRGAEILVDHRLTPRQAEIVLAGGLLNYIRESELGQ